MLTSRRSLLPAMLFGSIFLGCATAKPVAQVSLAPAPSTAPITVSTTMPTTLPAASIPRGPLKSPEVSADGHVTVRLFAPRATSVVCESLAGRFPMQRGTDGVWAVTFGPLEPDVYEYAFNVDGMRVNDPANPAAKTPFMSFLPVNGREPTLWEIRNVPHGKVQFHWYDSKALGIARRVHVYTPPGYSAAAATRYPVLYLLHGSGDDDSGWVNIGRADLILDNLIALGKVRPMIVVMPEGHTAQNPRPLLFAPPPTTAPTAMATTGLTTTRPSTAPVEQADRFASFASDLLEEVIPLVEREYLTQADAAHRGIAGLSMGGGQSLRLSVLHPERFSHVVLMSAGFRGYEELDRAFPIAAAGQPPAGPSFKLFWIGCGSKDRLFPMNQKLDQWLTARGIKHEFHVGEGGHDWRVWRRNLIEVAPMLFNDK